MDHLDDLANPETLRLLLGKKVLFMGRPHRITDLLADGPQLVLEDASNPMIQDNAYGRAYRRAPDIVLLPIFTGNGTLNPELGSLHLID